MPSPYVVPKVRENARRAAVLGGDLEASVAAYPASDQDDLYGMADVDDRCPKPIRVRPGAADWVFARAICRWLPWPLAICDRAR
jgi:hypothetical protein